MPPHLTVRDPDLAPNLCWRPLAESSVGVKSWTEGSKSHSGLASVHLGQVMMALQTYKIATLTLVDCRFFLCSLVFVSPRCKIIVGRGCMRFIFVYPRV